MDSIDIYNNYLLRFPLKNCLLPLKQSYVIVLLLALALYATLAVIKSIVTLQIISRIRLTTESSWR